MCEGGVGEIGTEGLKKIELLRERDGEVVEGAVFEKASHCSPSFSFHCFPFLFFSPPLSKLAYKCQSNIM